MDSWVDDGGDYTTIQATSYNEDEEDDKDIDKDYQDEYEGNDNEEKDYDEEAYENNCPPLIHDNDCAAILNHEYDSGNEVPKKIEIEPNKKISSMSNKLGWSELVLNKPGNYAILHKNSCTDFFVQTTQGLKVLPALVSDIQKRTLKEKVPLKNKELGALCLAQYLGDFYRAEVVNISNEVPPLYTVFFFDYGNEETVTENELLELNKRFTSIPRCVVNCIWDMAVANELNEKELSIIDTDTQGLEITARKKIAEGQYLVSIRDYVPKASMEVAPIAPLPFPPPGPVEVPNASETAAKEQGGKTSSGSIRSASHSTLPNIWNQKNLKYSINLKTGAKVVVVFIWGLNSYVVMAVEDSEKYTNLQATILKGKYSPVLRRPAIGDILLGMQEGMYYRGRVIKLASAGCATLEFLDIGDTVTAKLTDLRHPDEELMKHPIYGMNVVLDGIVDNPPDIPANEEINSIWDSCELKIEFKEKPGDKSKAILWIDEGRSLNTLVKKALRARTGRFNCCGTSSCEIC